MVIINTSLLKCIGFQIETFCLQIYKLCHEQSTLNDGAEISDFVASKPVDELRDGADVAALLVLDAWYCGVGYLDTIASKYTFSISAKDCAVGYYTFGHEVGHNVGAHHDPDTSTNTIYSYGHGHLIAAGNGASGVRTIMAYSATGHSYRVNHWSNPEINYSDTNTPTGVAGLSDNARLWQEKRASLAAVGSESGIKSIFIKYLISFVQQY